MEDTTAGKNDRAATEDEAQAAAHARKAGQHEIEAAAAAKNAAEHEREAERALDLTKAHEQDAERLHADAGQRTRDAPGPAGSPAAPRHDAGTRARSAARRGARETARAGTDASAPGEAVSADAVSVSSSGAIPSTVRPCVFIRRLRGARIVRERQLRRSVPLLETQGLAAEI